jgi:hypothetical protein
MNMRTELSLGLSLSCAKAAPPASSTNIAAHTKPAPLLAPTLTIFEPLFIRPAPAVFPGILVALPGLAMRHRSGEKAA